MREREEIKRQEMRGRIGEGLGVGREGEREKEEGEGRFEQEHSSLGRNERGGEGLK